MKFVSPKLNRKFRQSRFIHRLDWSAFDFREEADL